MIDPGSSHSISFKVMVEHFADWVQTAAAPRYPVAEATANVAAIEALLRSAHNAGAITAVA